MSHIKINKKEFESLLEQEISEEFLDKKASYLGVHWNKVNEEKWDVEVYPDRPDLLSVEGLARAYKGFKGLETGLKKLKASEPQVEVEVHDSVQDVRPYIGGLIVRNIELTERMVNGLIQLQEKLHKTQGRERKKIAIGLHDLESIEPPLEYKAVEPDSYSFTPLDKEEPMNLDEILEKHEKGREYGNILAEEENYPVIVDSNDSVISFPPIINSRKTEVDTNTENIFVDVTGTDKETVENIVNIIAFAFDERDAFIEHVEFDGELCPTLETVEFKLDPDYVREILGVEMSENQMIRNLEKMRHAAEMSEGKIAVETPSYRTDILHRFDLVEDVAIAHGYNKFTPEVPNIHTEGLKNSIEEYTEVLRDILSSTGSIEANTYILSNEEKLGQLMNVESFEAASMSNALSEEYSMVRNWIFPSLIASLERNKHRSYPQKLYEIGDAVVIDDSPTGASNQRKAAYVAAGNEVDFNTAREVIQVIERDLGVDFEIKSSDHPSLKSDRAAEIYLDDEKIGFLGEVSETVRKEWQLDEVNIAGFEFEVEKVVNYLRKRK